MKSGAPPPPLRATRLLDQVRERLRYGHYVNSGDDACNERPLRSNLGAGVMRLVVAVKRPSADGRLTTEAV
jgi:hypothetical protein